MPKYITKQRHRYTCGHTAVANAAKFVGKKLSYKDAISLVESVKYQGRNSGTWPYQIAAALDKLDIKYRIEYNNNSKKFIGLLQKDVGIIYLFSYKKKTTNKYSAHWTFIDAYKEDNFRAFNLLHPRSPQSLKDQWYSAKIVQRYVHHTRVFEPELYDVAFIIPKDQNV